MRATIDSNSKREGNTIADYFWLMASWELPGNTSIICPPDSPERGDDQAPRKTMHTNVPPGWARLDD